MGLILDIVFAIVITAGIGIAIFYFIKNIRDKKKSVPVYGLSYSGEYTQKNFWTNEIVIFAIITQGFSFLKLSLIVNIMMLSLILMLIFLYFTQILRGAIGKNGIVSAKHFYEWRQVDSVEWITGLQAENPGYPSWGLVRFHTGSRYVEFIIKKKAEEEVRSFVEEKMNFAKAN
ncbi:hypothetical protein [Fictibacillus arsenicus]|jgi:hypothetical protein|uniref:DUF5673 domain-containing protein n=1 Tax=Fictibacillus arsenicus TaxID=255247 RepID=A0A1V3G8V3_9BACL|nr:hypothetical protein [Fictibacillus arsenicus]OOE12840.1 hypothetical protein UN64_12375 [Fictibacillus arsenicus]